MASVKWLTVSLAILSMAFVLLLIVFQLPGQVHDPHGPAFRRRPASKPVSNTTMASKLRRLPPEMQQPSGRISPLRHFLQSHHSSFVHNVFLLNDIILIDQMQYLLSPTARPVFRFTMGSDQWRISIMLKRMSRVFACIPALILLDSPPWNN
jgi:hypothetical protein